MQNQNLKNRPCLISYKDVCKPWIPVTTINSRTVQAQNTDDGI